MEFSIKPGSADRYSVQPPTLRARPGETVHVTIRLRIIRFAHRMRAQRTGQKDVFHVKASDSAGRLSVAAAFPRKDSGASLLLSLCMQGQFFDQKFFSTFFLSPDAQEPTGKALPSVAKHSRTPSPELRLGVGDNSTFLRDVSHMRAFCVGSA